LSKYQGMTTKSRAFLIMGLFILILIGIRMMWISLQLTPAQPHAVQGQLDLRSWDFNNSRSITLNGEWEFYPNRLIMQESKSSVVDLNGINYIKVPDKWNAAVSPESKSAFGYGSYRLRILIEHQDGQSYSIRMPNVATSSELYVNGDLLASNGQPAASPEQYVARSAAYSASFTADKDEIEIIVHVANFVNPINGGLYQAIKLGSEHAVNKETWFSIGMQLLLCAVLLIHALYACILFVIGVRQWVLILFILLNLSTIMMTLLADDRMLLSWLPISYEWAVKLVYVSVVGIVMTLLAYTGQLLKEYSPHRFIRWFSIICLIIAVLTLLSSVTLVLQFSRIYFVVECIAAFAMLRIMLRATLDGVNDAIFLLLGALAIATNIAWSSIYIILSITGAFYPIDLIAAFLAFAAFWFKGYFRAFDQTKKLAFKLQLADKQKDDFLANTSHELRNPLHGMLNMAQAVLDSDVSSLGDKNVRNLELLITVGRRMSFMLNDLLDLKKLQENGIRLNVTRIPIQTVVSGVLDMLRFMTEGKSIRLINEIPDTIPSVMADENRLVQILFNLLHNAVKFTNDGTVTVLAAVKGSYVQVVIKDTGIGMDEETQRRIFEPYEQGDSSITAISGGIGLGLSIARNLLELHGSKIQVSSTLGQGSEFTFSLPLAHLTNEALELGTGTQVVNGYEEVAAASISSERRANMQSDAGRLADKLGVLVVDDDPVNLNILFNILDSERYEVVTVTNGMEALATLDTRVWDIIIADVMMPQMSGYELSSTIRERFSMSELPILLLTARSRPEDIEAGFHSGANDYVTKPVEAKELRARVRALTEMRGSVRERLRMEAAWLQAQIRPHFLFNTLNSVAALSEIDTSRMRGLLEAFGKYLKASFDTHNTEQLIPLEQELELVHSYLFIEKERFEERLEVLWEVDANIQTLKIPPLSIQPLVENAVRHGILKRVRGGTVRIRITEQENEVIISVSDNGVGIADKTLRNLLLNTPERKSGIGLLNIERRLMQIYGRGLHIQSTKGYGTEVIFRMTKMSVKPT
jgi:two-component system sensor histidine kinase ChiS